MCAVEVCVFVNGVRMFRGKSYFQFSPFSRHSVKTDSHTEVLVEEPLEIDENKAFFFCL